MNKCTSMSCSLHISKMALRSLVTCINKMCSFQLSLERKTVFHVQKLHIFALIWGPCRGGFWVMQFFISLATILPQWVILKLQEQHKYLKYWQERRQICCCLVPILGPEKVDWGSCWHLYRGTLVVTVGQARWSFLAKLNTILSL